MELKHKKGNLNGDSSENIESVWIFRREIEGESGFSAETLRKLQILYKQMRKKHKLMAKKLNGEFSPENINGVWISGENLKGENGFSAGTSRNFQIRYKQIAEKHKIN